MYLDSGIQDQDRTISPLSCTPVTHLLLFAEFTGLPPAAWSGGHWSGPGPGLPVPVHRAVLSRLVVCDLRKLRGLFCFLVQYITLRNM